MTFRRAECIQSTREDGGVDIGTSCMIASRNWGSKGKEGLRPPGLPGRCARGLLRCRSHLSFFFCEMLAVRKARDLGQKQPWKDAATAYEFISAEGYCGGDSSLPCFHSINDYRSPPASLNASAARKSNPAYSNSLSSTCPHVDHLFASGLPFCCPKQTDYTRLFSSS
ncbi:hypothetical protein K432DRAFT_108251 [Lepidopterella palustris CBS 459.81]|uniref:Uncharacterized protein n=1 Tax=Lepidopterella palustris CBS 459.81 TaxID=1314670 RepID=A0A8E2E5Q4_9PEZI|nr:hypothetical protein K432DRAFT_108251 [Lepidopterella palustris CBS 459.81]